MRAESPSQPDNDARLELADHRPADGSRQVDDEKLREIHQRSKEAALYSLEEPRTGRGCSAIPLRLEPTWTLEQPPMAALQ